MSHYSNEQEKEKRQAIMGINRVSDRIQKKTQEKLVLQRKLEKVKTDINTLNRELDTHVSLLQSTTIIDASDVVE